MGVDVQADFALAFMMIHEVPDQRRLLGEIHACLKLGGKLLVAEPQAARFGGGHLKETVAVAKDLGFQAVDEPQVHGCRAVAFEKA